MKLKRNIFRIDLISMISNHQVIKRHIEEEILVISDVGFLTI